MPLINKDYWYKTRFRVVNLTLGFDHNGRAIRAHCVFDIMVDDFVTEKSLNLDNTIVRCQWLNQEDVNYLENVLTYCQ